MRSSLQNCIKELEKVCGAYGTASEWYLSQGFKVDKDPSNWEIVKTSHQNKEYKGYISLREGLLSWAEQYNMTGTTDLYIELALWAVAQYYNDCLEVERKMRKKEAKEFCLHSERSEDEYWRIFYTKKPYHEILSLSESIYFEDELDTRELQEQGYPLVRYFFSKTFPFVFAPAPFKTSSFKDSVVQLADFENILDYDRSKTEFLERALSGENLEWYEPEDWYFGSGWDPREELWRDFEKNGWLV